MRTTISLDDRIFEAVKRRAAADGRSVSAYIAGVLDILEHPNQEKYSGQRIMVVNVEGYAYFVAFVEDDPEVFLKTIIPSRKATRNYLGGT